MKLFKDPTSFLSPANRVLIAQLWVTSVAGTALVLVLQTVGQDAPNYTFAFRDWAFTANRALRYILICWFTAHLIVASVLNEMLKDDSKRSLAFDILQSIAGFAAMLSLGFVTQDLSAQAAFPRADFSIAFLAIGLIGLLAAIHNVTTLTWAQAPRVAAAVVGGGTAWVLQYAALSDFHLWIAALLGTVLCWAALVWYWKVRRINLKDARADSMKAVTLEKLFNVLAEFKLSDSQRAELVAQVKAQLAREKPKEAEPLSIEAVKGIVQAEIQAAKKAADQAKAPA